MPEANDLKSTYVEGDPELSEEAKSLLTQYSKIPEKDLVRHVRQLREKAWTFFQYPCIGMYTFLDFSITQSKEYPDVLERLRCDSSTFLLDLGCCFGQDLRALIHAGVPPTQLKGIEYQQTFLDLGYELFNDRAKLPSSTFSVGDFVTADLSTLDVKERQFDFIYAASFFHLFGYDDTVRVMSRAVRLLKGRKGDMIFGRQTGSEVPGTVETSKGYKGVMYRQSPESFRRMVEEVVSCETGVELECEVKIIRDLGEREIGGRWALLRFVIAVK